MRVCLVSREIAPFWGAGIGVYAANAAAAWARAGHDVHLLTPVHADLTERGPTLFPGVRIHTIDPALNAEDLAPRPYEFQRYAMRVLRNLERLHAATPFDCVEFPDYWAEGHEAVRARRAANALPGAVLCIRLHTPNFECRLLNENTATTTEILALEREEDRAIREADLILSPTRSLLDMVSKRLGLGSVMPARAVVPYPLDAAGLAAGGGSTNRPPTPSPAPEVLYFGRLERRKGVHVLVQAAAQLLSRGDRFRVRCIGNDTQSGPGGSSFLAHLRSLIPEGRAESFTFEPAVPRDELTGIIRAAAASGGLCCFPSLWENFPNACLEAMALGAPVVASDAGGMAEIIQHERSGLLFASGDARSLGEALRRCLADAPLRARLGAAAPGRVRALCDPATVIRDTVSAIELARARPVVGQARRPLRIALVSREFAPFFGGGIGSYNSQMAAALAAAGHEVHVLTAPHENLQKNAPYLRPGVRFHTVDVESGRAALGGGEGGAYPVFPMRYAMAVHDALTRLCATARFDYVEFPDYAGEGYFAIRAKRTLGAYAGTVLAVRHHSPSWVCREADREPRLTTEAAIIEHMERAAVAEADAVVAPATSVLERITLTPPPMASLRHTPLHAVIPCPIDVDDLLREVGGADSPSNGGPSANGRSLPTVLFFGKLQYLKGPHDLVAAALTLLRKGTSARFRFIGNDSPTGPFGRSMLDHLRTRIGDAGARFEELISFEPARPRNQLAAAIREAVDSRGLCCFPSHWESFPNVCIEAMALSAPVVVSDVGGLAAIVEHERNGLRCPVGDPPALAAAIGRLLTDTELRQRLAAAAPGRIREFCNPAAILDSLTGLIETARARVAPAVVEAKPSTRPPVVPALISALAVKAAPHPSLTVIIPFFNLGRYLPQTLSSLARQTRKDFVAVIVNDGSSDTESVSLLRHLERTRPDLTIIHQENRGLSATRNAGLRAAATPWVMPLDSDDLIAPTLIEKAMAVVEAHPELDYASPMVAYFVDDPDRLTGGWVPLGPDRDLLCVLNCAAAASGTVVRREAALAAGGYDEWMTSYEDWDLWCSLAERGGRGEGGGHGTVIPEFLLWYRVRPDSMYRTEATVRHAALHAHLLARHARLPADPGRVLRLLAGAGGGELEVRTRAQAIVAENIRYRMADRVNDTLKRTGIQQAIKGLTVRVLGGERKRSRP